MLKEILKYYSLFPLNRMAKLELEIEPNKVRFNQLHQTKS